MLDLDHKPSPPATAVTNFIPGLDGLRGIAVFAVFLFHLGIPKCSLGWAGVELFFVISGFLITRILFSTRENPDYFTRFYRRRILRIFPIYYLVLIGYTAVVLIAARGDLHNLPFYYVFLQTIPQLRSHFADSPLLNHTWSLAIEEQFYLFWPMVVFLLKGPRLFLTILSMIAGGLILRCVALIGFDNPFLVDGWLGVHIDSLAAGALVAYAMNAFNRRRIRTWMSIALVSGAACLIAIAGSAGTAVFWSPLVWCRAWYAPLVISAMACTFAGAVGLVATEHPGTRWLETRFLMRWGKISYGIYLFHPFTSALVSAAAVQLFPRKTYLLSAVIILAKLSSAYFVAWLSWQLIEGPISRMKNRISSANATQEEMVRAPEEGRQSMADLQVR
jgi:peptidoglycan/LPS O-acetylase OafA/YrhL